MTEKEFTNINVQACKLHMEHLDFLYKYSITQQYESREIYHRTEGTLTENDFIKHAQEIRKTIEEFRDWECHVRVRPELTQRFDNDMLTRQSGLYTRLVFVKKGNNDE